jgi:CRP/FNR family transcriptional regulator
MTAETVSIKKDSYLFLQGDEADCMYIVKTGKIGLYIADYLVEKMVSQVGPGELIGEMSLFDHLSRSASAKALTDAELVVLPFEKLREDLNAMPEWVQVSMKTMALKIRQANNIVLNTTGGKGKS